MPFLVAAVVLVGVLTCLNLLLTYGVIRKLRTRSQSLSVPSVSLPVGAEVGEFSTTTVAGRTLTQESLQGETLVAFFSPACRSCHEQLPIFTAYASLPDKFTVAVVLGSGEDSDEMARRLGEASDHVVIEPYQGSVSTAFQVAGTPAFVTVTEGKVSGTDLPETPDVVSNSRLIDGSRALSD